MSSEYAPTDYSGDPTSQVYNLPSDTSSNFDLNTTLPQDNWGSAASNPWGSFQSTLIGGSKLPRLPGVDFGAPDATVGQDRYQVLPFRIGTTDTQGNFQGFDPTSHYNYQNPSTAIDTLSTWARAVIPGANDLGNAFKGFGENIGNSGFGKAISNSPLAPAGQFVGSQITGALNAMGGVGGDLMGNLGDAFQMFTSGDFDGAMRKWSDRAAGPTGDVAMNQLSALHRDNPEEYNRILGNELALLSFIPAFGVAGKGAGVIAGTEAFKDLAASMGGKAALKVISSVGYATKLSMAVGYGLEIGMDVSAHFDPSLDAMNQQIASQHMVGLDSPLRGAFDLIPASFIDPIPALGRLANNSVARGLMDSGALRLQSPAEVALGAKLEPRVQQEIASAAIAQISRRELQIEGTTGESALANRIEQHTQEFLGEGPMKGLASDHTAMWQKIQDEVRYNVKQMVSAYPEFETKPFTADDYLKYHNEWHANELDVQAAQRPMTLAEKVASGQDFTQLPERAVRDNAGILPTSDVSTKPNDEYLQVRHSVATDKDFRDAIASIREIFPEAAKATSGVGDISGVLRDNPKAALTTEQLYELSQKHPDVFMGDEPLNVQKLLGELRDKMKDANHEVVGGPLGPLAERIRTGNYKLISGPHRDSTYLPDEIVGRNSPAMRAFRKEMGAAPEKGVQTLSQMGEALRDAGKDYTVLARFEQGSPAAASADGLARPLIHPDSAHESRMPSGTTKLGTWVAGFRHYLPNRALGQDLTDQFFKVHNERYGMTREETNRYMDAIKKRADDVGAQNVTQLVGRSPDAIGVELKSLLGEAIGKQRASGYSATQALMESMPRDDMKSLAAYLMGQRVGKVGAMPSLMAGLRATAPGTAGEFYRYFAQVLHPMMRYTLSPIFNTFVRLEPGVFNMVRGASGQITDPILKQAAMDSLNQIKGITGKQGSHAFSLPSEQMASEATAGKALGSSAEKLEATRANNEAQQIIHDFPQTFANRYKQVAPEVWKDIRGAYRTDREAAEEVLKQTTQVKNFLAGKITEDQMVSTAGISAAEIPAFRPIMQQVENSLRDVTLEARNTHMSNPQRSYVERSLNHPLLVYPLSWTMKAAGEWARFLTHSAFGLNTGMAGLVGFNDIRDATMHALTNDPDAKKWVDAHSESIKVAQFLMPGTPWSVGFGLMGVATKDMFQIANNVRTGQKDPFANATPPWNIGILRDAGAVQKIWAEWQSNRPKPNAFRFPGL